MTLHEHTFEDAAATRRAIMDDAIAEHLIADGHVPADIVTRRTRLKNAEMEERAHLSRLRRRLIQDGVEIHMALCRAWDTEPARAEERFTKKQIARAEWRHGKLQRARRRFDAKHVFSLLPPGAVNGIGE